MPIPEFTKQGNLPTGIIRCNGCEFIERFCSNDYRESYKKAITDILDFSVETGAGCLFFGGSFITETSSPHDIDCLILYAKDEYIPPRGERLKIGNIKLDVMFASLEHKYIADSYVYLFSKNRYGADVGVIQIDLYDENNEWEIVHPGFNEYEIIKRAYINRHIEELNEHKGVLVTIHGLLSHAEWNKDVAPISSSQGWIFAPYIYNYQTPKILFNSNKRKEIVNNFREWIYDLRKRFDEPISIIAHSFGTYILAAYLEGFEKPPVSFNCVILTGSIINTNFNWNKHLLSNVSRVLNEIAPNDQWVKFMPNTDYKKLAGLDILFGKSGVIGFFNKFNSLIIESTNDIFDHNNVIKRDIIETKWMPFLDANQYAYRTDLFELMKYKRELEDGTNIL
ncbi:DUF6932 family protein [Paenibacillus sp. NPDC055715]